MFNGSITRSFDIGNSDSEEASFPSAEANIYGVPYTETGILQKRKNSIVNSTSSQLWQSISM